MNYSQVKTELKKRCSNIKYFNKSFYNAYIKALEKTVYNVENEIDDSYYKGIVKLFHSWDAVYNSRFYNDNSCAYCEFLGIVCKKDLIPA